MPFDAKAYHKAYRQSEHGRAVRKKARASTAGKAGNARRQSRYRQTDHGQEAITKYVRKSFVSFKKGLAARIECLNHTSPEFRPARVQEILDWSRGRFPYWVESEING